MVTFVPFAGYRPALMDSENIGDRVCPPYDTADGYCMKQCQSHQFNVSRFSHMAANGRYLGGKEELDSAIADGMLSRDTESFYVYRQTYRDGRSEKTGTAIIGLVKAEKYEDGNVILREEVPSKIRNDRIAALNDTGVQTDPVTLIVPGFTEMLCSGISDSADLLYSFSDSDGTKHEFFQISDIHIISAITAEAADQKALIADGAADYEAAIAASPDQYALAAIVSSDDAGFSVRPMHRLLKAGDIGENSAVKKIMKNVAATDAESSEDLVRNLKNHRFGIIFKSGKCMFADTEPNTENPMLALDVYVAQSKIVNGVYKADEGKSKVTFDSDVLSVVKRMENKEFDAAVVFSDPSYEDIWNICSSGKRMPKRSADFLPKIWSGFVVYRK